MTHVSHVNDVAVVYAEPDENWVRLSRDLTRPPTAKAMPFQHDGRQLWIAKAHCRIYAGSYYAKTFAFESAVKWAEAAKRNDR